MRVAKLRTVAQPLSVLPKVLSALGLLFLTLVPFGAISLGSGPAAGASNVTLFTDPGIVGPTAITEGADGALWFVNTFGNSIGRITTSGVVTTFKDPSIDQPRGIALGSDGALWFTNSGNGSIGRITTAGVISNFPEGPNGGIAPEPWGIAPGPGGAMWFVNNGSNTVGEFFPSDTFTGPFNFYADIGPEVLPGGGAVGLQSGLGPMGITEGPDNNMWISYPGNGWVGSITTDGRGALTFYGGTGFAASGYITAGPDGNLWFPNGANAIGRITTSGTLTNFTDPGIDDPFGIAAGPDGALWFTNTDASNPGPTIGRITTSGSFSTVSDPVSAGSEANYILASADTLWFTNLNSIGVITGIGSGGGGGSPTEFVGVNVLSEGASVTSTPAGISCIPPLYAVCSASFPLGTAVTLTATPPPGGWTLNFWTGACAGDMSLVCVLPTGTDIQTEVVFKSPVTVDQFPISSIAGQRSPGTVAFVTVNNSSLTPASSLSISIDWGDGSASPGALSPASTTPTPAPNAAIYGVSATHTYKEVNQTTDTITVTDLAGHFLASAQGPVNVESVHPTPSFVANPNDPVQSGISLFIPKQPDPGQTAISQYKWVFLDGDTVVDNKKSDAAIMRFLPQLFLDPSNTQLRSIAIQFGILPSDANGGFGGIGGLTDANVRQVATVWEQYFPQHIVPHLFDFSGNVGVSLTVTDRSGHQSIESGQNFPVATNCAGLVWGGNFFNWFSGFTPCDTFNGIASQFGPHRDPDYIEFGLNNVVPGVSLGFGGNGGVSVVIIPKLLSSDPSHAIFISVNVAGGVNATMNLGPSEEVVDGWLGPPNQQQQPQDSEQVANFVNGADISGGFAVQGFLGFGFNALLSPSTGLAGEVNSYSLGVAVSVALNAGKSCSAPVDGLSQSTDNYAGMLYNQWKQQPVGLNNDKQLLTAIGTLVQDMLNDGFNSGLSVITALANCASPVPL